MSEPASECCYSSRDANSAADVQGTCATSSTRDPSEEDASPATPATSATGSRSNLSARSADRRSPCHVDEVTSVAAPRPASTRGSSAGEAAQVEVDNEDPAERVEVAAVEEAAQAQVQGGTVTDAPDEAASPLAGKRPPAQKKKAMPTFDATHVHYNVVTAAAEACGWRIVKAASKAKACIVHWCDDCGTREFFPRIEPWMRINHFPGMHNTLGRKSRLAKNLARLRMRFPKEYNFLPETWILPDDTAEFERQFDASGMSKAIYIAKPDGGAQGRGIFLCNSMEKIKKATAEREPDKGPMVVQKYLRNPMLIDGMKFDLRLYFLVAGLAKKTGGWEPRLFLFRDGLVRLCTTEYVPPTEDNLDKRRMHLTNYAVNKNSQNFVQNDGDDDGAGSKRRLRWFLDYIGEAHGEEERQKLWKKLKAVCVKTLLGVHPTLEGEYINGLPRDLAAGAFGCRSFEVLGIDVMLDRKRRPFLLEVNTLPSFTCDSPLDEDIKSRVIRQSFELTCSTVSAGNKQAYEAAVLEVQAAGGDAVGQERAGGSPLDNETYGDFERAYPPCNAPKAAARYEAILSYTTEVFKPVLPTNLPGGRAPRAPSTDQRSAAAVQPSGADPTARTAPLARVRSRTPLGGRPPAPSSDPTLPPRPPGPRHNSTAPQPPTRVASASPRQPLQQQPMLAQRSRSAPERPSRQCCDLPAIPAPAARGGSGTPRLPQQASRRAMSRDDVLRAQPLRLALPVCSVHLSLPPNSRC